MERSLCKSDECIEDWSAPSALALVGWGGPSFHSSIHSSLLQADCSIPGYIRHFYAKTGISKREHLNGNFQTRTPKRESPNQSFQTGTSRRESISAELQNPLTGDATTALHLRDHFVALPRVRTSMDMISFVVPPGQMAERERQGQTADF